jgi:N4-gp56 family major capsid protein
MAFRINMSGTTELDNSIVLAFDQGFIVAAGQNQILADLATYRAEIGAKSIALTKYSRMAIDTAPLDEYSEAEAEKLSDSEIVITPAEYGKVVTRTKLASLQSGGKVDIAAATLVGMNMGQTMDKLAINALAASTNVTQGVLTGAALDEQYSKLARESVMPAAEGLYVALMHEDEVKRIRNESGFEDVAKYANAMDVLRNEVGVYKGHRIVRHNLVAPGDVISLGFNALGLAVSQEPGLVISGPFDNLARFVNVGWHGVFGYNIVDDVAVQVLRAPVSGD